MEILAVASPKIPMFFTGRGTSHVPCQRNQQPQRFSVDMASTNIYGFNELHHSIGRAHAMRPYPMGSIDLTPRISAGCAGLTQC
jgi:hypothetical protein